MQLTVSVMSRHIVLELLDDLRNGLRATSAMAERILDFDLVGLRAVSKLDLNGVCDTALLRIVVVLRVALLLRHLHKRESTISNANKTMEHQGQKQ